MPNTVALGPFARRAAGVIAGAMDVDHNGVALLLPEGWRVDAVVDGDRQRVKVYDQLDRLRLDLDQDMVDPTYPGKILVANELFAAAAADYKRIQGTRWFSGA